jgi:hypothetical protein
MARESSGADLLRVFSSLARDVSSIVGWAPEDGWSKPSPYSLSAAHPWSNKDLLAHIVSIQASLPTIIRSRADPLEVERAPFDPERWNEAMLRHRNETPPWSLVEEMVEATDELDAAFEELPLDATVRIGWHAGHTMREALGVLADHQTSRLDDLRGSLGSRGQG